MKKMCTFLISLFAILTMCFFIPVSQTFATSNDDSKSSEYDKNIELLFEDIDDKEEFIQLPDGSFLHGTVVDVDAEDTSIVYAEYSSINNPDAITTQEVKEIMIDNLKTSKSSRINSIQPRGADLPTQIRILTPGSSYISSYFSGSGWRFGGYYFQASSGSVGTMEWSTYNDSGRVGLPFQAANTLGNPNSPSGTPLYVGKPEKIGTKMSLGMGYHQLVYYTYNPSNNPYYMVRLLD